MTIPEKQTHIIEMVDRYKKRMHEDAEVNLSAAGTRMLTEALTEAQKMWPIRLDDSETGFLLVWNEDRTMADDTLTPAHIEDLAEAIRRLNKGGIRVTLGKSTKGYTYLNLDTDDLDWIST